MNHHFHTAAYYLRRAAEHTKLGVLETTEPVRDRVRSALGREPEPEPGTVESLVDEVTEFGTRAEDQGREVIASARQRFRFRGTN